MAAEPARPDASPSEAPTVSRPSPVGRPASATPPATIGPYVVKGLLASGGMGDVYECRDERLSRSVAVKVAHPGLAADGALMAMIRDEGRRLASVKRTALIARVLAAGDATIGGVSVPYVAMEFEENAEMLGGPVSNAWPIEKKVEVFALVCRAVEALHEQHLVHADIKPSNILIVGDEPRLIDFGIARVVRRLGGEPGQVLAGTPGYLDPSLASGGGRLPDQLSDEYALGVTLAAFLTGRSPGEFGASSCWPTRSHPASRECPAIDAELDGIILRAAEPDRDRRFKSVAGLRERLEGWSRAHTSPAARVVRVLGRARAAIGRGALRRPVAFVLGAGTLAAAGALTLSPVLFGWTGIACATQPLEAGAVAPAPCPRDVRLIEMRDAPACVAAMGPAGARIPLGQAGAERLVWAGLARKIAAAGGARAVGLDLIFRGEATPHDSALREALGELANATEARGVLVGLERWDDRPYASIAPAPPISSACVVINPAEPGLPPTLQLAVSHQGRATLEPSFALVLAAMTLQPGADFRVDIDAERRAVRVTFERAGRAGAREEFSGRLVLEGLSVDPPNDREQSRNGLAASDRVVRFPAALATDADLAAVSKDAAEVLSMNEENLRGWILGRTLVLCDARDGRDTPFRGPQGLRPGAKFQACAVESLIGREYLRQPSWSQAGLLTWAAAVGSAWAGWILGGAMGMRNRLAGLGFTFLAGVLAAGIFTGLALWAGTASGYLVNPMVVAVGALGACVLAAGARSGALASEAA